MHVQYLKVVVFKNCAPSTDYISEINNAQIGNAKDIDVVIQMYNLIEYSNNQFYGNTIEMNYFQMLVMLVLIFMLLTIRVLRLNLNKKQQVKQLMVVQKMFK